MGLRSSVHVGRAKIGVGELTKVYRQGKDEAFARLLNGIRVGDRKLARRLLLRTNNSNNNNNVNKEERGLSELHLNRPSTNAHNKTKMDELRTEAGSTKRWIK